MKNKHRLGWTDETFVYTEPGVRMLIKRIEELEKITLL